MNRARMCTQTTRGGTTRATDTVGWYGFDGCGVRELFYLLRGGVWRRVVADVSSVQSVSVRETRR